MTNLFYPALSIYLQKRFPTTQGSSHRIHHSPLGSSVQAENDQAIALLSAPVLDNFFPYPPPLLSRLSWTGWWHNDVPDSDDNGGWAASRVRAKSADKEEQDIVVLRVAWADVGDVLDSPDFEGHRPWTDRDDVMLDLVRRTAEGWDQTHRDTGASCVRHLQDRDSGAKPVGDCYILSPTEVEQATRLSTLSGIQAQEEFETAGTGTDRIYHSIATIFRVPRLSRPKFETLWRAAMETVAAEFSAEVFVEARRPEIAKSLQTESWLISVSRSISIPVSS